MSSAATSHRVLLPLPDVAVAGDLGNGDLAALGLLPEQDPLDPAPPMSVPTCRRRSAGSDPCATARAALPPTHRLPTSVAADSGTRARSRRAPAPAGFRTRAPLPDPTRLDALPCRL